jgi:putative addiction module component (TIGR02574 family)
MSATTEQILKEALALPPHERAELVEQLLQTFQSPPDPLLDELWAREADERLNAYEQGELIGVPAEEVFEKIRQRRMK